MKLNARDEFNLAAKTVAETFNNQFPEAELDADYTETAYADLKADVQAVGDWRNFHDKVAAILATMTE